MSKYLYGFELEGFATGSSGEIILPPKDWPVDGFPGLVELRTTGGMSLEDAYFEIMKGRVALNECQNLWLDTDKYEHTFSPEQKHELRRSCMFHKDQIDVQNLYGKKPRSLGNKTIASFQINVSLEVSPEYTRATYNKRGAQKSCVTYPAVYHPLDVPRIVRALDNAFLHQIRSTKRQPGLYAIKGGRLEYRSLPNAVFPVASSAENIGYFLSKIRHCVEGRS